jgi:hypothetical protein
MDRSQKKMLGDMQVLAEFANLKDADIQRFRDGETASTFFPAALWEGQTANGAMWKTEQARVRDAWRTKFPPESSVLMITEIAKLTALEQRMEQIVRMTSEQLAEEQGMAEEQGKNWISKPECFPFQMAVMNLTLQPWRAAVCEVCGLHFIKMHQRNRYCSTKCSTEAVLRTKRVSWAQHGQNWRKRKAAATKEKK